MELSPEVGATVYRIDRAATDALGKGDATPLDDVLLTLPGVAKDSKASGSLHVRDDHGNMQYRINGVQLPDGISGFGQSLDTRYIDGLVVRYQLYLTLSDCTLNANVNDTND